MNEQPDCRCADRGLYVCPVHGFDARQAARDRVINDTRLLAARNTEAVIAAARAATLEWDALRAKMTREPFMPRTTREALDALSAAVVELDKAGRP